MENQLSVTGRIKQKVRIRLANVRRLVVLISFLALMTNYTPINAMDDPPIHRVNAPYFTGAIPVAQTAITWFGRVTPTENYADVRIGYNSDSLLVHFAIVDRRLWYDSSPTLAEMPSWDSASLYLDLDGNIGATPDANAYHFIGQLNSWESRAGYQGAYRGTGSGWASANVPFTASSGWRGDSPNSGSDDRGWVMSFQIPFSSLGLAGKPVNGTVWGLGLVVHDRDDPNSAPVADKTWPEPLSTTQPASWGELVFGLPKAYVPQAAVPGVTGTTIIREGLKGVIVPDAPVGGHTTCGSGTDYWSQWGNVNYGGVWYFNIQNNGDIADWPCLSKYYINFPLDLIPQDKVILDAEITLYQFGGAGAGWTPAAQASLIQAFTVEETWTESTLTWNNAPLRGKFVGQTWVDPTDVYLGQPGKPWNWTVTSAVAEAYATGAPLQLVFYESDTTYHAGKYFRTSEEEEYDAVGRPTLTITWGDPVSTITASAQPTDLQYGETVVFNLVIDGSGYPLIVNDTLPQGVSEPTSLSPGLTFTAPNLLTWTGTPAYRTQVVLSYAVAITTPSRLAIMNQATLTQASQIVDTARAVAFVDPLKLYFPQVYKALP